MTENLLLAGISACVALLVDWAGVACLARWNPSTIPRVAGISVDGRVLAFTAILALATTIVFGIAPAAHLLRGGLVDRMNDRNPSITTGGRRFREGLVIAEMALAVVLLTAAGLMLRTLWSLQHLDLGFRPAAVLTMRLSLPATAYQSGDQVVSFYDRLLGDVRALPGVVAAGAARSLPLAARIGWWDAVVDGYTPPAGATAKGDWEIVTDGYLETMGETVVRGRSFTAADNANAGWTHQRRDGAPLPGRPRAVGRPVSPQPTNALPVDHGRRHRQGCAAQRRHDAGRREVLTSRRASGRARRFSGTIKARRSAPSGR